MINQKYKLFSILLIVLTIIGITGIEHAKSKTRYLNTLEATIIHKSNNNLTIQDSNNLIYTFQSDNLDAKTGDKLLIKYTGLLDNTNSTQNISIKNYEIAPASNEQNTIPNEWLNEGIFSKYHLLAYNKLKTLSLDEKIGQLFLIRYPDTSTTAKQILTSYYPSGFVFYEKDFQSKTKQDVINMINTLQNNTKIPLLTAVDEEGGKVVRISSNPNLADEKFKSPQELYQKGYFEEIRKDTIEKSRLLKELGINLNLAPVVDVSTNKNDYIYERSLGLGTELTSTYAKTVIQSSYKTGVSYTLKHFPGYGNNKDTHISTSIDNRSYEDILNNDIPPFKAGIDVGAEAVLISHNTVTSIDQENPASLSPKVHNILRGNLNFTGITISDDLSMNSVSNIEDVTIKALLSGNNLIITSNYQESINSVKDAINTNYLDENYINKLVFHTLSWKYYKGLMLESQK